MTASSIFRPRLSAMPVVTPMASGVSFVIGVPSEVSPSALRKAVERWWIASFSSGTIA